MRIFITVQYIFCEQGDNFNAYLRCHAENVYEGVEIQSQKLCKTLVCLSRSYSILLPTEIMLNALLMIYDHPNQTQSLMIATICFTNICGPHFFFSETTLHY